MSDLTKKQKDFIEYYILTLNPAEAAILAGYSKDKAAKQGHCLLSSRRIASKIKEKVDYYTKNLYITNSYVVNKLLEIIDFSMEKEFVLNKDGTESDRCKYKDSTSAIRALLSLSKFISSNSNIYDSTEKDLDIENLDIDKI